MEMASLVSLRRPSFGRNGGNPENVKAGCDASKNTTAE